MDDVKTVLERHRNGITAMMQTYELSGTIEGINYTRAHPFRGGKQQPVWITTLSFPEGETYTLLEKLSGTAGKRMERHQPLSPALQRAFPPLLLATDYGFLTTTIRGLELGPFEEAMHSPEFKERGFRECVEMVNSIFTETPLSMSDIDISSGHNIMYDLDKRRFTLFDYNALGDGEIEHTARPFEERWARFLNGQIGNPTPNNVQAEFFLYGVRTFSELNPGRELFAVTPTVETRPSSVHWKYIYNAVHRARPEADCERRTFVSQGYILRLDPEVEKMAVQNDMDEFRRILGNSSCSAGSGFREPIFQRHPTPEGMDYRIIQE